MKKYSSIFFLAAFFIVGIVSCKKINEATALGENLIPSVDNIHTFEIGLNSVTDNRRFIDTTRVRFTDHLAVGDINDPEFGQTKANFYFNLLPDTLGRNPFLSKDTMNVIDSVVLSLDYQGAYGDTNAFQTIRVYEIATTSGFSADTLYKYADPTTEFATTGAQLGVKTFQPARVRDSVTIQRPKDTTKVANVVRIKLDNSIGTRFSQYDTSSNSASGGYHLDETRGDIFRSLFAGLAIKADNGSNVLTYFSLLNPTKTKLTVYFKIIHSNGTRDTLSTNFYHSVNGQANYVKMTPAANWATYLNNGTASDDKIYLQTTPSGSYASVLLPDLSSLGNKVIHRAELIATKISSTSEDKFTPPTQLFLDRKNSGSPDSSYLLSRDLFPASDGSLDFSSFGGFLRFDKYTFNVTRFVQGVVTRYEPIDTLRLFAPLRVTEYAPAFASTTNPGGTASFGILSKVAAGRVVLGGGTYINSDQRLKLRIIYSNL